MSSRSCTVLAAIFCAAVASIAGAQQSKRGGAEGESGVTLTLRIEGAKSDDGQFVVLIYNSKKGFPTKAKHASVKKIVPIKNGKATVPCENLKPGEYAINVFHDKDRNGKLKTNLIGMPKEGTGVSNNGKGIPSWKKAKFSVGDEDLEMVIQLRYL